MNACRFCTARTTFADGYKIFIKYDIGDGNEKSIEELMTVFKDYSLTLEDDLPKISCKQCYHKIIDGYNFYMMAKRSETSLIAVRDQIKSMNLPPILPTVNTKTTDNVRCFECHKKFENDKQFAQHYKTEHKVKKVNPRLYQCSECDAKFRSYYHLKEHRNTHVNDGFCSFCNMGIFTRIMLKLHKEAEHTNSKFVCRICVEKAFSNKFFLKNHFINVHNLTGSVFFCYYCEQQLNDKELLKQHLKSEHPLHEIELSEPNYELSQDNDLNMNEEFLDEFLLNQGENDLDLPESCWQNLSFDFDELLCGDSMLNTENSTADDASTTEAKQYKCPMCTEEFGKQFQMNVHLVQTHNQYVLCCRQCGEKFNTFDNLRKHRTSHGIENTKNSELGCKICNKTFKTKQGLRYHTLTHESKQTEHKCLYCEKAFPTALNLRAHVKINHSNVKQHQCKLCDRPFATLDHLKKHVLSFHQKERNFSCTQCSKRYAQRCHLKKHMEVHEKGTVKKKDSGKKKLIKQKDKNSKTPKLC